ncbi:unnamed protein product [Heterobilharzia americana]|nr:unnamed protein product [Heterobilharzia americana]
MDGTKTVRRRTHDYEFSENNQFRRKRKRELEADTTDSIEILGESHVNFLSKNAVNTHYWSQDTPRNDAKCFFPNGNYGESRTVENMQNHNGHNNNNNNNNSGRRYLSTTQHGRSKERIPHCGRAVDAHSSSLPSLPPSLRESERMLYVQRWINSIPPDLPSWIQVSHNKIVPVTNPYQCFPEVEESSLSELPDSLDPSSYNDILDCTASGSTHNNNDHVNSMNYFNKLNNHSSNPAQTSSVSSNIPGASDPSLRPHPLVGHHVVQSTTIPSQLSAQNGKTATVTNTVLGVIGVHFPNVSGHGGGVGGCGDSSSVNPHQNLIHIQNYQSSQEISLSNHNYNQHQSYGIESDCNKLNYSSGHTGEYETTNNHNNSQRNPVEDSINSNGRLFNDMEVQMIVKPRRWDSKTPRRKDGKMYKVKHK